MDAQVKHQAAHRVTAPQPDVMPAHAEGGTLETENWQIKLGKMLFYITVAISLWFFYWLNGIQCPC